MEPRTRHQPSGKPFGKEAVSRELISSAARLIAKHGVEGVTTRSIAAAAGVNHGLISRHFGGKDELVKEVARTLARRLFDESRGRRDTLASALDRGFTAQGESVRTLVRILLYTEALHEELFDDEFFGEIFEWLQRQGGDRRSRGGHASTVRLYLVAVLILGGEVVGPSIRRSLKLGEAAFESLRRRAMRLILTKL